jgi:hypothetical protein
MTTSRPTRPYLPIRQRAARFNSLRIDTSQPRGAVSVSAARGRGDVRRELAGFSATSAWCRVRPAETCPAEVWRYVPGGRSSTSRTILASRTRKIVGQVDDVPGESLP